MPTPAAPAPPVPAPIAIVRPPIRAAPIRAGPPPATIGAAHQAHMLDGIGPLGCDRRRSAKRHGGSAAAERAHAQYGGDSKCGDVQMTHGKSPFAHPVQSLAGLKVRTAVMSGS